MELRQYIKYKDFSQKELAGKIGITPVTFGVKIKKESFTIRELRKLSEILNCSFIIDDKKIKCIEKDSSFYEELKEFTAQTGCQPGQEILINGKRIKILV